MHKDDAIRIHHMLDAAQQAIEFAQGKTRRDLDHDPMLMLSLVKLVEIIGEAASQVTEEGRARIPAIPWADIVGTRHRLVHAYFDINRDILWRTVVDDLPALLPLLKQALHER